MGRGSNLLEKHIVYRGKRNPNIINVWFPSVDDIVECIESGETNHHNDFPWTTGSASEWAGTKDMPQALHYLKYGWPEVAEEIYLEDAALAVGREIEPEFVAYMDVTGGAVDVATYLTGQPECMVNFEIKPRNKKTVSVLFNVCNSAGRTKADITKRGHIVTCICDYLERSGYRVRIDVADTANWYYYGNGNGSMPHWTLAFCAKDYNQALDFGRIGYMLGSPAMLRRIFFGVEASSALWGKHFENSFGCVASVHPRVGNEYDYVFDYNTPLNEQSAAQCIEYIISGKANQSDITGEYENGFFDD